MSAKLVGFPLPGVTDSALGPSRTFCLSASCLSELQKWVLPGKLEACACSSDKLGVNCCPLPDRKGQPVHTPEKEKEKALGVVHPVWEQRTAVP